MNDVLGPPKNEKNKNQGAPAGSQVLNSEAELFKKNKFKFNKSGESDL